MLGGFSVLVVYLLPLFTLIVAQCEIVGRRAGPAHRRRRHPHGRGACLAIAIEDPQAHPRAIPPLRRISCERRRAHHVPRAPLVGAGPAAPGPNGAPGAIGTPGSKAATAPGGGCSVSPALTGDSNRSPASTVCSAAGLVSGASGASGTSSCLAGASARCSSLPFGTLPRGGEKTVTPSTTTTSNTTAPCRPKSGLRSSPPNRSLRADLIPRGGPALHADSPPHATCKISHSANPVLSKLRLGSLARQAGCHGGFLL